MPITPGTPLASGDLPAATADAQTNAAEIRTAIGAMENTALAVNTAIATDPASTREAMQTFAVAENKSLRGLKNLSQPTALNTLAEINMIVLGDSFNLGPILGLRGISPILGTFRPPGTKAVTGGAVFAGSIGSGVAADYTKTPDGKWFQVPDGGTVEIAHLDTAVAGPVDKLYYCLFPGTGTAVLEWSTNGSSWTEYTAASFNTADTGVVPANSAKAGFVIPNSYKPAAFSRIRATGGTVHGIIGQSRYGSGINYFDTATSGLDIGQVASINENVWKQIISGWGINLIVASFADYRFTTVETTPWPKGSEVWAESGPIDTLHTWSKAANANVDWMIIGAHRVDPSYNEPADAVIDPLFTALGISNNLDERIYDGVKEARAWAMRNNEGFLDTYHLLDSYASGVAAGFFITGESPVIHFTDAGKRFQTAALVSLTNFSRIIPPNGIGGIRYGKSWILDGDLRTGTAGLLASASNISFAPVPVTAQSFRAAVAGSTDESGAAGMMQFSAPSASVARIGNLNQGAVEFGFSGSGGIAYPVTVAGSSVGTSAKPFESLFIDRTITAAGTTGNQTIDKCSGRVNFAAGQDTIVVTSNKCAAASIVVATIGTDDATATSVKAIPAAGSFTLKLNATATAETAVNWMIFR